MFDASGFMCRGDCGQWSAVWATIYIGANISIAGVYLIFAINALLLGLHVRRRGLQFLIDGSASAQCHSLGVWTCATFIVCGAGHVIDHVLSWSWPAYHFFAVWHTLTFITSGITAVKLSAFSFRVVAPGGRPWMKS